MTEAAEYNADMPEVLSYVDVLGHAPFDSWMDELAPPVRLHIQQVVTRMGRGNLGDTRSVGGGVIERRIHFGPGYRIYFGWEGSTLIILLGGGDKSDQRGDIARARRRWQDYRNRQRG